MDGVGGVTWVSFDHVNRILLKSFQKEAKKIALKTFWTFWVEVIRPTQKYLWNSVDMVKNLPETVAVDLLEIVEEGVNFVDIVVD